MAKGTAISFGIATVMGAASLFAVNASAQVSWEQHGQQQPDRPEPVSADPEPQANVPQPGTRMPSPQNSAATEPVISCHNAQSLKASLDQMIAPMSRAEQKSFMTGFFHYAYASRPQRYVPYSGLRRWTDPETGDLAVYSANGFLNDGRMDDLSPVRAYTAYSRSAGYSVAASYNKFLDDYCPNVEGMTREKLIDLGTDQRCLRSLAQTHPSRGIFGRKRLAEGCELPVLPIGK